MKKVFCVAVLLALMISLLSGCGAGMSDTASVPEKASAVESKADSASGALPAAEQTKEADNQSAGDSITGNGVSGQSVANEILSQRKVIRNANITLEVEHFDSAYARIKTIVAPHGFIQESNITKDKAYADSKEYLITRGTIIVRVSKLKFEDVLSGIEGIGTLLSENMGGEDVTEQYFDTESQLRLLRFEQNRLEQYLAKVTDPDTIFKTEDKLTQIRHEIEKLTGTIKKLDDLVELSTITINVNEKVPGDNTIAVKQESYGSRLSSGFMSSIKGIIAFCGELVIVLVQVLPILLIIGLIALAALKIHKSYTRRKNGMRGNNGGNPPNRVE